MSLAFRAVLLVVSISVCAHAQTRELAVYLEPALGLDRVADRTMRNELQKLLAPAGLEITWKNLSERKAGENFELVAVSSFEGSCATDAAPAMPSAIALADTSISNAHILPFFRVVCARVLQTLGSHVEPAVLGRALGRVMAHEIYHIVSQTKDHQEAGVAKAVFSSADLTAARFEFDAWSLARMRPVARIAGDAPKKRLTALSN